MDSFVDAQMVTVLARFLNEVRLTHAILDRELYNKANLVIQALIIKLVGPPPQIEFGLSELLGYICNLWGSGTITIKEIGYISAACQELENLR
jgi:hypothetical protein